MKIACGNQRGVSLIEILVVLVILLIGIMSAIRVFPTGFGLIQHSADVTSASRLAQKELASWTLDPANLPDGVLPNSKGYSLPNKDNCDEFRGIVGESTVVPSCDSGTQELPTYVLRFGPTADPLAIAARTAALTPCDFSPDSFGALLTSSLQARDLQRFMINEAGVDTLGKPQPWLYLAPTPYETNILVDYDYINSNGEVAQYRNENPVSVAQGSEVTRIALPPPLIGDFSSLVPGSVKVYRVMQKVDGIGALSGSGSPFRFAVDAASGDIGVLKFPPGLQGVRVHFSYQVQDWGILHEDLRVEASPDDGTGIVRVSIPFLKDPSGADEIRGGYKLMGAGLGAQPGTIAMAVTLGGSPDGSIANEQTPGLVIPITAGNWPPPSTSYKKDIKAGVLRLPTVPVGTMVRVYYRCTGDWAMSLSKAYSNYGILPIGTETAPPPMYCCLKDNGTTTDSAAGRDLYVSIFFPKCDIGKAAIADFQVKDADGRIMKSYPGAFVTIRDMPDSQGNVVGDAILTLPLPQDVLPNSTALGSVVMSSVRGVSVKVRVTWKEAGRTKSRELDSIIGR